MSEQTREYLSSLIEAIQTIWLEHRAMEHLLDHYNIPYWFEARHEYCQREESKKLAQTRFALARDVIQAAQSDSKALEALLASLATKGKAN